MKRSVIVKCTLARLTDSTDSDDSSYSELNLKSHNVFQYKEIYQLMEWRVASTQDPYNIVNACMKDI